jgi:hypothetical protein
MTHLRDSSMSRGVASERPFADNVSDVSRGDALAQSRSMGKETMIRYGQSQGLKFPEGASRKNR